MALALAVLGAGLWSGGATPAGADSWGHLYRAQYLAQTMRSEGAGAYFSTAWMPSWYMGDPFRTYYPPLTTWILTPFVYVFQDPFLAYRVFISLLLVGMAGLTYVVLANKMAPWSAALGAVLAVLAPYQVRTLFFEGNVPRALAILALPPIYYFTGALLRPQSRRGPAVVGLSLSWAWAILAHSQQAAIFALGFGLYILARLFLDPDVPMVWGGRWLIGLAGGALLSAAWWIPAYSGAELSGVPFLPAVKVELFVARLSSLIPSLDLRDGHVPIGFAILVLGVLAAVARPNPERSALVLAGLLAIWFAMGEGGVLFSLLPFHSQLLPERFLNFASFALAIAAAGLLPLQPRARFPRILVIAALLFIDGIPAVGLSRFRLDSEGPAVLQQALGGSTTGASRSALLIYPEPGPVEVYYSARGSNNIFGWALENTPHHPLLRRVLDLPQWGPAYLNRLLDLWNVGRIAVGGSPEEMTVAGTALVASGFQDAGVAGRYGIYQRVEPLSPVRALPDRRMLIVGEQGLPFLITYPFAQESSRTALHELPPLDPETQPMVGLTRFETSQANLQLDEAPVQAFVEAGGVAILDLTGMEDLIGRTVEFLGVDVLRVAFTEPMQLRWAEGMDGLPHSLPLPELSPEGWSGAAYDHLDEVLGEVEYQGRWWPILGYRTLGQGKAWFVGLNLLYYSQLTGQTELQTAVHDLTLAGADIEQTPGLSPLAVQGWTASGTELSFSVDVGDEPRSAVVSYTYSPRWRATVDDQPWEFGEYEHLLSLNLPAGIHHVVFSYSPFGTIWPMAGLAVSILGAVALAGGLWSEKRNFIPIAERATPAAQPAAPEFAPCANCGFRLAEVGPPSPITYPFQVVHCPICGMRMDDEGFQAGESLDEDGRQRALAAWLRKNDYDPEIVHTKWGFAAKEFFAPVPLPPPPEPTRGELSSGGE